MSALREAPYKLWRDSCPPSIRVQYTMILEVVEGALCKLTLKEEPYTRKIHVWSRVFDKELDKIEQIVSLMQAALLDLDQTLGSFQICIANVEAGVYHVQLWNTREQFDEPLVMGFTGSRYFQTFPNGNIDDTLEKMEKAKFNRLTIHCKRVPPAF